MDKKILIQYLEAARYKFMTASLFPVITGLSIALYSSNRISISDAILNILCVLFLHSSTNLANDYFDHRSLNDEQNTNLTPFSGGSRMIQNKIFSPKSILTASLICLFIGICLGLFLLFYTGEYVLLFFGILGAFIGFFYSAPPIKLGYRGLGEFSAGLSFGPLIVISACLIQTGKIDTYAALISIPIGICVSLILLINEFPDYEADKSAKKKTLVVIFGKKKCVFLFCFFLSAIIPFTLFLIFIGIIPKTGLLAVLLIPLKIRLMKNAFLFYGNTQKLIPVNAGMIQFFIFYCAVLTISFLTGLFL